MAVLLGIYEQTVLEFIVLYFARAHISCVLLCLIELHDVLWCLLVSHGVSYGLIVSYGVSLCLMVRFLMVFHAFVLAFK